MLMSITRGVFNSVDEDGSGEIDASELKVAMAQFAAQAVIKQPTDEQVEKVLIDLDTDKNGTIDVYEFKVLIKRVLQAAVRDST